MLGHTTVDVLTDPVVCADVPDKLCPYVVTNVAYSVPEHAFLVSKLPTLLHRQPAASEWVWDTPLPTTQRTEAVVDGRPWYFVRRSGTHVPARVPVMTLAPPNPVQCDKVISNLAFLGTPIYPHAVFHGIIDTAGGLFNLCVTGLNMVYDWKLGTLVHPDMGPLSVVVGLRGSFPGPWTWMQRLLPFASIDPDMADMSKGVEGWPDQTVCFRHAIVNVGHILTMEQPSPVLVSHGWRALPSAMRASGARNPVTLVSPSSLSNPALNASLAAALDIITPASRAVQPLHQLATRPADARPRVVIIDRGNPGRNRQTVNRRWTHLDRMVGLCDALGLECVVADNTVTTNDEVFDVMGAGTSVLVGVHGAGLLNMIYLPPDAVGVVEVMSGRTTCDAPEQTDTWDVCRYTTTLQRLAGMYGYKHQFVPSFGGPCQAPFIDERLVLKAVCGMVVCQQDPDALDRVADVHRSLPTNVLGWTTREVADAVLQARVTQRLRQQDGGRSEVVRLRKLVASEVARLRLCGAALPFVSRELLVEEWGVEPRLADAVVDTIGVVVGLEGGRR